MKAESRLRKVGSQTQLNSCINSPDIRVFVSWVKQKFVIPTDLGNPTSETGFE